jgi:hypothetical protein
MELAPDHTAPLRHRDHTRTNKQFRCMWRAGQVTCSRVHGGSGGIRYQYEEPDIGASSHVSCFIETKPDTRGFY